MTDANATVHLVYQMGKVGSSTVHRSLRAAGVPALHKVHYLSDLGVARSQRLYAGLARRVPVPHESGTAAVRRLLATGPDLTWKVVSLVREPIARDVSAYVQMVDVLHPELVAGDTPQVARIARAARAQFLAFDENRNYTCRWFDDELGQVFGIDVFAHSFDPAAGAQRLRAGRLDLLLMRMEDLDRVGSAALSEFIGRPVPLVRHSSRAPDKLQAAYQEPVYRQILRQVRVPEPVCQRVYASRYARHFYSAAELDRFTQRWAASARL
jgi:hypothetical protein